MSSMIGGASTNSVVDSSSRSRPDRRVDANPVSMPSRLPCRFFAQHRGDQRQAAKDRRTRPIRHGTGRRGTRSAGAHSRFWGDQRAPLRRDQPARHGSVRVL
jgi:hypothetical protein